MCDSSGPEFFLKSCLTNLVMVVITTISIVFLGDFTSVTYYKYAGENTGLAENISIITKPFNPFNIILLIVGGMGMILMATFSIVFLRRRIR